MKTFAFAAALAAITAVPASASVLIDFNSDAPGSKANGFVSDDSPIASFTDTIGSDLILGDYTPQSDGPGLATFGDDPSKLQIDFSKLVNNLTLEFGNDDPNFVGAGGLAVLEGYAGGTLIDTVTVTLNRNDIIDQAIGLGSQFVDQAVFFYAEADGSEAGLIEVVDNISFAPIPVPAGFPLLAGALGLAFVARRRKS